MSTYDLIFEDVDGTKQSKNPRAEQVMGLRRTGVTYINEPCEEGYHCPVCQYELGTGRKGDNFDERLMWSEYNYFLWCSVCNRDFPSVLCMPDVEIAINIFLDIVSELKEKKENE